MYRVRYVAQENLVAIETKADRKISHDLLPHVFEDFDAERAVYRPVQQLRVWYPADDLAPPEAQPELQQQRLDGVVRAMAALRSLLRAHALDARRDGLLTPALLLLAAAPSAADARVLERGCAAIRSPYLLRKWARHAVRAATLCATGCNRTHPGCIPTQPSCNRTCTYPRCAALLAAHESAPLAQHTASASQAAGRGQASEALRHLDLALEIDAEHADTWARRARLHAQEGQHTPALEAAQRTLNPDTAVISTHPQPRPQPQPHT